MGAMCLSQHIALMQAPMLNQYAAGKTCGVDLGMKPQRIMHEADLGVDIALKYETRQNHETPAL